MGKGRGGREGGAERAMIQRAPFGVRARGLAPPPASPVQAGRPGVQGTDVAGILGGAVGAATCTLGF